MFGLMCVTPCECVCTCVRLCEGGPSLTGGHVFSVAWSALSVSLCSAAAAQPAASSSQAPPCPMFPLYSSQDMPANPAHTTHITSANALDCWYQIRLHLCVHAELDVNSPTHVWPKSQTIWSVHHIQNKLKEHLKNKHISWKFEWWF